MINMSSGIDPLGMSGDKTPVYAILQSLSLISTSGIADRPCGRVSQFWPKVEDDILQTI